MTHGLITEEFGDGSYSFRLAYGQWLEVQEATNCGPLELYRNMLQFKWRVQHIREIIRMGLIGGGANPIDALRLVRRYVEDRPVIESVELALKIVSASLTLPKGEEVPSGEEKAETTSHNLSTSPPSTETRQ